MVLDSVPLVNSPTAAAKRVRLFGVNLDNPQPGSSAESSQDANALSLRMPGWQRPGPLRFFESPQRATAESSAASSPSSSSSSKREAHSSLDLDLWARSSISWRRPRSIWRVKKESWTILPSVCYLLHHLLHLLRFHYNFWW